MPSHVFKTDPWTREPVDVLVAPAGPTNRSSNRTFTITIRLGCILPTQRPFDVRITRIVMITGSSWKAIGAAIFAMVWGGFQCRVVSGTPADRRVVFPNEASHLKQKRLGSTGLGYTVWYMNDEL